MLTILRNNFLISAVLLTKKLRKRMQSEEPSVDKMPELLQKLLKCTAELIKSNVRATPMIRLNWSVPNSKKNSLLPSWKREAAQLYLIEHN